MANINPRGAELVVQNQQQQDLKILLRSILNRCKRSLGPYTRRYRTGKKERAALRWKVSLLEEELSALKAHRGSYAELTRSRVPALAVHASAHDGRWNMFAAPGSEFEWSQIYLDHFNRITDLMASAGPDVPFRSVQSSTALKAEQEEMAKTEADIESVVLDFSGFSLVEDDSLHVEASTSVPSVTLVSVGTNTDPVSVIEPEATSYEEPSGDDQVSESVESSPSGELLEEGAVRAFLGVLDGQQLDLPGTMDVASYRRSIILGFERALARIDPTTLVEGSNSRRLVGFGRAMGWIIPPPPPPVPKVKRPKKDKGKKRQ
jgi:hypothetical protein